MSTELETWEETGITECALGTELTLEMLEIDKDTTIELDITESETIEKESQTTEEASITESETITEITIEELPSKTETLTELLITEEDGWADPLIPGEKITEEESQITKESLSEIETTTREATMSESEIVLDGSIREEHTITEVTEELLLISEMHTTEELLTEEIGTLEPWITKEDGTITELEF